MEKIQFTTRVLNLFLQKVTSGSLHDLAQTLFSDMMKRRKETMAVEATSTTSALKRCSLGIVHQHVEKAYFGRRGGRGANRHLCDLFDQIAWSGAFVENLHQRKETME
jgi:hypothetical protein